MTEREKNERKNKKIGIAVSVGVHGLLLLLFFFLIAWRMPDPPPPGLPGMEINLGSVDAGSGDEQSNVEKVTEEIPIEEIIPPEVIEEATVTEEKLLTSTMEAPHEVKEVEKPKEEKKEKAEPIKEKKVEPVVDARNTFPNKTSNSDGDKNKKGDQGNPDGNPDSRNMYPGGKGNEKGVGPGGNGASMELPGWEWDSKPDKVDPTSESGYVLFEFFVDENGTVVKVKKIGGANFTPTEDLFYKNQLLETGFHLKDARLIPAKETRGVFKFEVRSK